MKKKNYKYSNWCVKINKIKRRNKKNILVCLKQTRMYFFILIFIKINYYFKVNRWKLIIKWKLKWQIISL